MKEGAMARRYELTAEQWRRIEGMLPGKAGDRDRMATDKRTFVNGVMWVLRSGALWKHLPEQYGRWKSVYNRFLRWEKAGIWEKIFAVLIQDPRNQYAMIDSMIVRAHQQSKVGKGSKKTRLWGVPEVD
jgi:transposase